MTAIIGTSGAGPLAVCDRVSRCYANGDGTVTAVADLSVEVPADARWALTGPSGSGKSTVLHLLAGLEQPTSGTVGWPGLGGHPLEKSGRVAMVFQGPSLLPQLTALENTAFPLQIAGMSDRDALDRAREALDRLGLAALSHSLPAQMSGGQAQRVAVGRVLAIRPRLILADEPTGQLDHRTAHLLLEVLLAAAEDVGAALVVSTHDPAVADRFTERWTMRDGHLRPGRP